MIGKFQKDHQQIIDMFDQISEVGVVSVKGQALLKQFRKFIVRHLAAEEEKLYLTLREKAKSDTELQTIFDCFDQNLQHLSHAVDSFMIVDHYKYSKKFDDLVKQIMVRIDLEENILFQRYNKLHPPKKWLGLFQRK